MAMARVAPTPPAETDLLCENCGYTLNGLPADGNCPECGVPVNLSISPTLRQPPAWEETGAFLKTTSDVIFRPTRFFRGLATRGDISPAARFGRIHLAIASLFFAASLFLHEQWYFSLAIGVQISFLLKMVIFPIAAVVIYFSIALTTRLAARLTNWEATYRGLRLPISVVLRGLYYHSAHYLPVATLTLITVAIFHFILPTHPLLETKYLYVLCGEVIVGAMYLFNTYWIGMRNMMYANR